METIQYPTKVKANKEHKCFFCDGTINKGDFYIKTVLKYESIYTLKIHLDCIYIADKLKMYDDCDEGLTHDIFIECINFEYHKIINDENKEIPNFQQRLKVVIDHHKQ